MGFFMVNFFKFKKSYLYFNFMTIYSLFFREILKMFREKKRFFSILLQPFVFWIVIGSGFMSSFKISSNLVIDYQTYFYPGVLVLVLLFSAIFSTITLIDDKASGFLQMVLVGPGSRFSLVLGKVLGVSSIAVFQSILFLLTLPLTTMDIFNINFLFLFLMLFLGSFFLASLGFIFAWSTSSTSAYHALMSIIFLPMWIISGALFPTIEGWSKIASYLNPMSWMVFLIRFSFGVPLNGTIPMWMGLKMSFFLLFILSIITFLFAVKVCYKYR